MGLQDVDFVSVFRKLADRRIEQAMDEGKFDNLEGAGKPLDLEPLPADETARSMYWALKIMKNADIVPDEVRLRREAGHLRREIDRCADDARRSRLVQVHNDVVRQLNTLGTNAIKTPMDPIR